MPLPCEAVCTILPSGEAINALRSAAVLGRAGISSGAAPDRLPTLLSPPPGAAGSQSNFRGLGRGLRVAGHHVTGGGHHPGSLF